MKPRDFKGDLDEGLGNDVEELGLREHIPLDIREWRKRINVDGH